jgi:hypothetical protein
MKVWKLYARDCNTIISTRKASWRWNIHSYGDSRSRGLTPPEGILQTIEKNFHFFSPLAPPQSNLLWHVTGVALSYIPFLPLNVLIPAVYRVFWCHQRWRKSGLIAALPSSHQHMQIDDLRQPPIENQGHGNPKVKSLDYTLDGSGFAHYGQQLDVEHSRGRRERTSSDNLPLGGGGGVRMTAHG